MGINQAATALQAAFSSAQILLPGSEGYQKQNGSYLSEQESGIQPACIFQPKTTEEVSHFVRSIKPLTNDGETAFAIRGAGNMPLPGCANIEAGITLDLSLLDGIELNNGVVSIGAGARWGAVYEKLQAAGLAATGGRSGTGGVGGLALTGGLSFFSSREGFISDNVLNFEVVLASGDIVNANATENADLWVALKGGSNNFGVVTRFDLSTFEQGPFWGGNVYYFTPSFPSQIEALVKELQKPDADLDTHIMISIGYAAQFGRFMCMNTVYHTRDVTEPPVLAPFTAIEPQVQQMNSLKKVTLTEASSAQAASVSNQVRCTYMNMTVKADVASLQAAADIYKAAVAPVQSASGIVCSLTLQPYPRSLLRQSAAKGGNSLGLDPAAGPAVSVLLLTYWKDKSDDDRIVAAMRGALDAIREEAVKKDSALDFQYLNYAAGFQDPIGSYGAENKRKLQEVSLKYDPDGLFQRGVPGGFKLF